MTSTPFRVLSVRPAIRRIMLLTPLMWGSARPVHSASYEVVSTRDATHTLGPCSTECSPTNFGQLLRSCTFVGNAGVTTVTCNYETTYQPGVCGRRPEGFAVAAAGSDVPVVGAVLQQLTQLEAAAVVAFERMHAELQACGAPANLVQRASAAAQDERRHTRVMNALAGRFGGHLPAALPARLAVRPAEEWAQENAAEGCVRETFGAVVASWQAAHAADVKVRHAMAAIAQDEADHAQLSLDCHAWVMAGLSPRARDRVLQARDAALAQLKTEVAAPVHPEVVAVLGLPAPHHAAALLDAASAEFWS